MPVKQAHILVSGRVQGVFFRGGAQRAAQGLKLAGFARNLADGRVEIGVEGEEILLGQFIDWCHKGPAGARVDDVVIEWTSPTGEWKGFKVL